MISLNFSSATNFPPGQLTNQIEKSNFGLSVFKQLLEYPNAVITRSN